MTIPAPSLASLLLRVLGRTGARPMTVDQLYAAAQQYDGRHQLARSAVRLWLLDHPELVDAVDDGWVLRRTTSIAPTDTPPSDGAGARAVAVQRPLPHVAELARDLAHAHAQIRELTSRTLALETRNNHLLAELAELRKHPPLVVRSSATLTAQDKRALAQARPGPITSVRLALGDITPTPGRRGGGPAFVPVLRQLGEVTKARLAHVLGTSQIALSVAFFKHPHLIASRPDPANTSRKLYRLTEATKDQP